jgi:hypothetical protein
MGCVVFNAIMHCFVTQDIVQTMVLVVTDTYSVSQIMCDRSMNASVSKFRVAGAWHTIIC